MGRLSNKPKNKSDIVPRELINPILKMFDGYVDISVSENKIIWIMRISGWSPSQIIQALSYLSEQRFLEINIREKLSEEKETEVSYQITLKGKWKLFTLLKGRLI